VKWNLPLGEMETINSISKWWRKPYRNVLEWAVVASTLATLRPKAPNTFTEKPIELEDWGEAVHLFQALHRQTDNRIMYMVLCQSLSADVKTWVKTLHIDSWGRLQREMQAFYLDPSGGGSCLEFPH
jgi:hypothetical protein